MLIYNIGIFRPAAGCWIVFYKYLIVDQVTFIWLCWWKGWFVEWRVLCWDDQYVLGWWRAIYPWLLRRMIEDHPTPHVMPWFGEPLAITSGAAQAWILILAQRRCNEIVVTLLCKFYNLAGKHPHAQDFEKNTRDRSIAINRFREGSKNQLIVHYYYRLVIMERICTEEEDVQRLQSGGRVVLEEEVVLEY